MSVKHTPGPWRSQVTRGEYAQVFAGNESQPVAEIATSHGDTFGPRERANAHLIAAAPDLLAALRAIAESSGRYDDPEHDADPIEHALVMRDIALGAIAKAEGR